MLIRSIGSICTATFRRMVLSGGKAAKVYAIFGAAVTGMGRSSRRPRCIEGVDDGGRHLAGDHRDPVKANGALAVLRPRGEPHFGGRDDALPRALGEGF